MGRPKGSKVSNEPTLIEYKNVTENELMIFEIYSEEDTKHMVEVKPNDTVFLSEKDLKNHKNDLRFLQGRIVPLGSDEEVSLTKDLTDTMTALQLEYFIRNVSDVAILTEQLAKLKSLHTVGRLLKESKNPEHMKTYEFVSLVEKKLSELTKEQDNFLGKVEKE